MRPIDADALMPNAERKGRYDVVNAYQIANAPTIDAVPVVHGYWRDEWFDHKLKIVCSICGCFADKWTDYCPNCGAKMDGGKDDENMRLL